MSNLISVDAIRNHFRKQADGWRKSDAKKPTMLHEIIVGFGALTSLSNVFRKKANAVPLFMEAGFAGLDVNDRAVSALHGIGSRIVEGGQRDKGFDATEFLRALASRIVPEHFGSTLVTVLFEAREVLVASALWNDETFWQTVKAESTVELVKVFRGTGDAKMQTDNGKALAALLKDVVTRRNAQKGANKSAGEMLKEVRTTHRNAIDKVGELAGRIEALTKAGVEGIPTDLVSRVRALGIELTNILTLIPEPKAAPKPESVVAPAHESDPLATRQESIAEAEAALAEAAAATV